MTEDIQKKVKGPRAGCLFSLLGVGSIIVGIFGGAVVGLELGIGPHSTGGTVWMVCGAILVGILAVFSRIFTSRRSIFYGISLFLWITILLLVIDAIFRK